MDSKQELQLGNGQLQLRVSSSNHSKGKTKGRKNLEKISENGSTSRGDGMNRRQQSPHPLIPRSSLSSSAGQEERDKEEDQSKPQKRPKLVWTQALHKKFVDAVAALGEANAKPKNIVREMGVDGITPQHISRHLQKYRLRKKEIMPANSSSNPGGSGERTPIPSPAEEGGGSSLTPPPGVTTPLCASAPPPYIVEYMKQEILAMELRLEQEGHILSPEIRENLENEIRGFKEKFSSLFGSSSP